MSLLTTIQDCCNELSLAVPVTVIGNTDPQVMQLLALANLEGQTFSQYQGPWGGWPELNTIYTFNLVPIGPYTGTLTPNSTTISSLSSVVGLVGGGTWGVSGVGLYNSTTITSVGANSIVVSSAPSVTSVTTGVSLNFGQIAYTLPSDIRSFINATYWDRNFRWPMLGPLSPVEWETIISGISPAGPRLRFRVVNNLMQIQPVPGTAQTDQIAYEYVSNAWCTTAAGATRTASGGVCRFAADTDLYRWPENVLRLGVKYRFLQAKGLDFGTAYQDYVQARDFQISVSGGSRSLRMNSVATGLHFLGYDNIPDQGYGTVT